MPKEDAVLETLDRATLIEAEVQLKTMCAIIQDVLDGTNHFTVPLATFRKRLDELNRVFNS